MKQRNQLAAGTILSYAQMAVGILINLAYTPVMIRLLGKSEYGLYNTVASTISTLSILSLGFNSSYIRYYSQYKKNDDKDAISKLNGLFLVIFGCIGITALICGLFLTSHLDFVFSSGLTEGEYVIARVLMLLLTLNLSISFPMSVFSNIISAHERFIALKLLGILKTVLGPLLTMPLLLMGYRSIAVVSVSVLVSAVTDLCYIYYVFHVLGEKFVFHDFQKGLFNSLFVYTFFIAINMIVDQINTNLDKVLLGRFKGTEEVALYSVGYTLYTCYMMFSTSISGVFTPKIHTIIRNTNDNPERQRTEITQLFISVGRLQFLILSLVATGFIFFGKQFIVQYWAGPGYESSYYVGLLLILPSSIALIQNLGIEIQRAENKHQFRSIAYLFMALANLVLSVYLCQIYGSVGSAIGTAVSFILANGLIMNIYYYRQCNINIPLFWESIIHLSKGLIIPIVFGILSNKYIASSNIVLYMILIIAYVVVYSLSMFMFGLDKKERKYIFSIVRK